MNFISFSNNQKKIQYMIFGILAGVLIFCSARLAISRQLDNFNLGIGTHISYYQNDSFFYLELLKKYGFTSLREEIPWSNVEVADNVYNIPSVRSKNDHFFSTAQSKVGISPLFLLDYGHPKHTNYGYPDNDEAITKFVNYAEWIGKRYKGKVYIYEVWNEWLRGTGIPHKFKKNPPNYDIYFSLVKQTSLTLKKIDSSNVILAGSLNPFDQASKNWLFKLIDHGLLEYVDGISIHPYSYANIDLVKRTPEGNIDAIDQFEQELKRKYNKDIPIYITEIGVPTYSGIGGLTESEAGLFTIKYILLAKSRSYIKGVWWYDLIDDGNNKKNKEDNFGLFFSNNEPKLAALYLLKYKSIIDNCMVESISETNIAKFNCNGRINYMHWDNSKFISDLDAMIKMF